MATYEVLPPAEPPAGETEAAGLPVSVAPIDRKTPSSFSGFWHLCNAILGVGILVLPAVTARIGIGTFIIFLCFTALLTYASLSFLTVASARSGHLRYSDVARVYSGLFGSIFVDISLIINCGGLLVVYYIILGDLLVGSGHENPGLLNEVCGDRQTVLLVLTLILIVPLVSTEKLRGVAGVSLIGVFAILLWAAVTVLLFFIAATNNELKDMHWWPTGRYVNHGFESAVQTIAVLPIILVAYACQMTLQHVLRENETISSTSRVGTLSGLALTVATVAFAVVGVSGSLLFGKNVDADVLKNFTVESIQPLVWTEGAQAVFLAVRLAFVVSLIASFPIQILPLREAVWKLFFRQNLQGPGLWVVTYALLAAIYFVGMWVNGIWEPLLIIGSTAGVLLAFIMPGVFALKVPERLSDTGSAKFGRMVGGFGLVVFGIVIGVFGILRVVLFRDQLGE